MIKNEQRLEIQAGVTRYDTGLPNWPCLCWDQLSSPPRERSSTHYHKELPNPLYRSPKYGLRRHLANLHSKLYRRLNSNVYSTTMHDYDPNYELSSLMRRQLFDQ
ncbi:hypothetical protein TWF788_006654 [Orbilia oligospora]|uniref:Uncharacterized protein n=1 Tax=Orbilia oligospora TaxID=2813651 RepID=A0A7C8TU98_ORBOL|nr:hypothetical protein TWF788_006654 [Orbilia oligospora]